MLCFFISLSLLSHAQRECVSPTYIETIKNSNPSVAKAIADAETFSSRPIAGRMNGGASNGSVIKIPVVVHVVYNNAAQNISDAQIQSQIAALNRDFRRDNADSVNTPSRFSSVAADVAIEFSLATADPSGAPTTGIVRKYSGVSEWANDDKIKFSAQGGDNAWDSKDYLNIWVGAMHRMIGYSSTPGGPADKDGIVITPSVFGTINTTAPYNMGRTAVHEVGHWLGLKHIWGDTYCGDDGIDDTPKQGNYTPGCPSGFRSSCSNGEWGDMYMNYMDFTYDACMNLFTNGQKVKMRGLFAGGGPRASMLESKGLAKPWNFTIKTLEVTAAPITTSISIYPNPANNNITINFGAATDWVGKKLRILNITGVLQQTVVIRSQTQKIDLSTMSPGVYLLQGSAGDQKFSQAFVKQ